jgi:hypothetical protein
LSLIAVYLACFKDWTRFLSPGERGTVMIVACDRKQARVIVRYITAFLEECSLLAPLIQRKAGASEGWAIDLEGRVTIEVHSCSYRAVRGYTIIAALLDEIAFWRTEESANPDKEVIEAIRPALATVPGSMLLAASFRKRGIWYRSAERPKSDLYKELLPVVNSRRVELLDDAKLVAQLVSLERRVGRGGRDSIDHPPGMHDDVANAVAGVVDAVLQKVRYPPLQQVRLHWV